MKKPGALLLGGLILLGIAAALFRTPTPTAPPVSRIQACQSSARLGLPVPLFLPAPDPEAVLRSLQFAKRFSATPGVDRDPVRPALPDPTPTRELVLMLAPGADAAIVARDHGLQVLRAMLSGRNAWLVQAETPEAAVRARPIAAADPRVAGAYLNRRIYRRPIGFTANDPYIPAGGGFAGQWHLAQAAVPGAWAFNATGKGIVLGIVDDGMETFHPDLAAHFDAADSINTGANPYDGNVNPHTGRTGGTDDHGTAVSGVAAAVGNNGIGVTGAAPEATLSVQRLDFDILTDVMLSDAVGYHATGSNPPIQAKNHSYGSNETYIESQLEKTTIASSAGSGTIHSYAAGNGFGSRLEDSNKFEPQNSADVICVAAIGSDGFASDYSSFGANVFVTAPSSSFTGFGITTTDRVGNNGYNPAQDTFPDHNYTSVFGGTSSATPLVTGIIALGRQANPALDVRLAQHALVRSADLVHATDGSVVGGGDGTTPGSAWKTNAAGFKFNQNYGFGRINAGKFITEVVKYSGVSPLQFQNSAANVNQAILDSPDPGIDKTFTVTASLPTDRVETVLVSLDITHPRRGDLQATLTSPSGTVSRLMVSSVSDIRPLPEPSWAAVGLTQWTFATHAFWGEDPTGTWHLRVLDVRSGSTGTWNSFSVTARMGLPLGDTTPPVVQSITRAGVDPTGVNPLQFTVKFSEFVTGVDPTDFSLAVTGSLAGASISSVTGGIDTWTVNVNPGVGIGTIQLLLNDDNSIVDGAGNALGGAAVGDGSFLTGETYTVDSTPATISVTSSTADGLYLLGAAINIGLTFSEPLTLSGGTLIVHLDSGGQTVASAFTSQSSLNLTYFVGPNESSADLSISSLQLSGGATLRDAMGTDATLTIAGNQNLAFAHAIQVDTAPPVAGTVIDGFSGADITGQTSRTTVEAHWAGFSDAVSGLQEFRWAVGSRPFGTDAMGYTSVGLATSGSTSRDDVTLSLSEGGTYYVTVEATDNAGNVQRVASSGFTVTGSVAGIPKPAAHLDALPQSTAVQVVWVASPDATVTQYRLWWKPSAASWTAATLVDNLTGTSTTVGGLTLGVSYDFRLRASTATGNESASLNATATTIDPITANGTGGFGTIQAALSSLAVSGGTVLVQAGTYAENLTLPKGVTLLGISPRFTILQPAAGGQPTIDVSGGLGVTASVGQLTVAGGAVGIRALTDPLAVDHVIVHHATGDGILGQSTLTVTACTLAHNGGSGAHGTGATTIHNTIVTGNGLLGLDVPPAATVTYADCYANTPSDYPVGLSLATNVTVPVLFTNEAGNDYTEAPGSFSIDSGDPADPFVNEPDYDGGRVNLGAFGNTSWAAPTPVPAPPGGGGGGGGCGLLGLEGLLLLLALQQNKQFVLLKTTFWRRSSSSPS